MGYASDRGRSRRPVERDEEAYGSTDWNGDGGYASGGGFGSSRASGNGSARRPGIQLASSRSGSAGAGATRRSVGHAGADGYKRDRGDRSAHASWHGNARDDYGTRSSSQYGYRRSGASGYRSSYAARVDRGARTSRVPTALRTCVLVCRACLHCGVGGDHPECDCPQRRCCG